jgi:septal ring factor EnvC (AmiA/AmiB activator)
VAKVYPELVIRDVSGTIRGVRYEELTPMLLNEVQQQHEQLAALKEQLTTYDAKIAAQDAKLAEMQQLLAKLQPQAREERVAMR